VTDGIDPVRDRGVAGELISYGIDVGGTGIKGAPVDLAAGTLVGPRQRVPTPRPARPDTVIRAVRGLIDDAHWNGPVGVAVPGVVVDGTVTTAANISSEWIGLDARSMFAASLEREVTVLNDADAAGLAEARFGAAAGIRGVVLQLTFGTGIGSALLNDGVLVPNTEFGHLEFRGTTAEDYAAGRLVKRESMNLEPWAERVNGLLGYLEALLSPTRIIIGGGISKRFEEFAEFLDARTQVVPALLRNNAGIVGAALAVREGSA
jgi:polyphosphate glucokinase